MNNPQSPLIPQGSLLEQKNKGRARVKIAVFFVLAVHGIGLLALLMQGCRRDEAPVTPVETTEFTNPPVVVPTFVEPTNPPVVDSNMYVTPGVPEYKPPVTEPVIPPIETTPAVPAPVTEYKVVKGDTYSGIAGKFGVTIKALLDANPGVEPTRLQIGQVIKIPPATVAAPETTSTAPVTNGYQIYSVKSGDTLSRIAGQFGTTVRAIRSANNLTIDRITVGQKLKIPTKSASTSP